MIALNSCKEKAEWTESNPGATTLDFIDQKSQLDEILAPILLKLTEPRMYYPLILYCLGTLYHFEQFRSILDVLCLEQEKPHLGEVFGPMFKLTDSVWIIHNICITGIFNCGNLQTV